MLHETPNLTGIGGLCELPRQTISRSKRHTGSAVLLGVDIGTSSLKSKTYDIDGRLLGTGDQPLPIIQAEPTWAEQDPNLWWKALTRTIKIALRQARVTSKDIAGVGIDCFSPSLIPIEKSGDALRNAITPLDVRSVEEVAEINEQLDASRIFEITGNRVATSTSSLPSILWIKKNEPRVFTRAHQFVHANSYLGLRLTGACKMDWSNAALTALFATRKRHWSDEIADRFEIPLQKLPELCGPTEVVGETTSEAKKVGLRKGIPVAAGSIDTNCAALGAGVVKEGQVIDSGGATSCIGVTTDEPHFDARFLNRCHALPGKWIIVSQGPHTGVALRWFRDEFCEEEKKRASRLGVDSFEVIDKEAAKSPPGSNGVIFLPYFMGECSPIWNPFSAAVFFGLRLGNSKKDLIRSIMEGTAFNIRENLAIIQNLGIKVRDIRSVGGQAKSRLWLKIRANVINQRISVPKTRESAPLGSAILGGVAADEFSDPAKVASEISMVNEVIEPERSAHEKYQLIYSTYLAVYESLKPTFRVKLR